MTLHGFAGCRVDGILPSTFSFARATFSFSLAGSSEEEFLYFGVLHFLKEMVSALTFTFDPSLTFTLAVQEATNSAYGLLRVTSPILLCSCVLPKQFGVNLSRSPVGAYSACSVVNLPIFV
jgi:hypothetical protein